MIGDTVGITIAGVGISEANKLPVFGSTIGTTIGAGVLMNQLLKKKKGGF